MTDYILNIHQTKAFSYNYIVLKKMNFAKYNIRMRQQIICVQYLLRLASYRSIMRVEIK